jgi:hypothetical protein
MKETWSLTMISVTFGLPNVDDDYLPLYSGKVLINSDHGEKLSIPYGGLLALFPLLKYAPSLLRDPGRSCI